MIFKHDIDEEVSLVLRDDSFIEPYVQIVQTNVEHLKPFSGWIPKNPEDFDEAKAGDYLKKYREAFANGNAFYLGILYKGQLVGEIGYNWINTEHKTCTVGYWLAKSATGKGLVHRALKELLYDAFVTRGLNRVVLEIASDNIPSQNVASRLGFTIEGTQREAEWLHDHFADMTTWSILKREYKPR